MRKMLLAAGGLMLLLPLARGQDEPKKAAAEIKAIIAEYGKANQEFIAAYKSAKTVEERKEALTKRPNAAKLAARLMPLVKADVKSDAAGEALVFLVTNASFTADGKAAVGLVIEHHAKSPALAPALDRLSNTSDSRIAKFFERVAKENPNAAVKEAAAAIGKLMVGKVVPDIVGEDTDGKEFKLSDYRGKVVLLDFWGHW